MAKRLVVFVLMALLSLLVSGVAASGDEEPEFPEHAHVLLLNAEIDFVNFSVTYDKCVDLASNNQLKLLAHHEHLHFGSSGVSFGGESGHVVVPARGFPELPWEDCASLALIFPPND